MSTAFRLFCSIRRHQHQWMMTPSASETPQINPALAGILKPAITAPIQVPHRLCCEPRCIAQAADLGQQLFEVLVAVMIPAVQAVQMVVAQFMANDANAHCFVFGGKQAWIKIQVLIGQVEPPASAAQAPVKSGAMNKRAVKIAQ